MPGFFTDGELATDPGSIFDYGVSLGELATASAEDALNSPWNLAGLAGRQARVLAEDMQALAGAGDLVDAETARAEVTGRGLDLKIPKGGITRYELEMLQYLKQREIDNQTTFARPRPLGGTAVAFAGSLAGSLADPVTVASSFIPIISQARYAAWLARAGEGVFARAAVRASAGAIEGVAGAALLEPVAVLGATSEQRDYELFDSFLNVAFGGVIGGGLHVIGGAVYDRATRGAGAPDVEAALRDAAANLPEATQREMFQSAVAAIERGEPVDVAPIAWRVWHGSPHEFDAFSTKAINSGEGAQTYGRGLYLAEARDVGEHYKAKLAGPEDGYLYEVEIDAPKSAFVDFDAKLSEQSPEVQAAFKKLVPTADPNETGQDAFDAVYQSVMDDFQRSAGDPSVGAEVTRRLMAEGIRGNVYLDQKSRGVDGGGTRNVVAFSDQDLRVVSRNGEPVARSPVGGQIAQNVRDLENGRRVPTDLAGLVEQSRADRTQEAFNRQFVDKADETLAAEKAKPKDKIEAVKQDEAEFNDIVEEYRTQGRLTTETVKVGDRIVLSDVDRLKQADELAAWAERRAKAFEAAAGCIEAA